jgi:hypothetical protein
VTFHLHSTQLGLVPGTASTYIQCRIDAQDTGHSNSLRHVRAATQHGGNSIRILGSGHAEGVTCRRLATAAAACMWHCSLLSVLLASTRTRTCLQACSIKPASGPGHDLPIDDAVGSCTVRRSTRTRSRREPSAAVTKWCRSSRGVANLAGGYDAVEYDVSPCFTVGSSE